ncbi:MAG TPA: HDOD domain-containing protein [Candidatus Hydrogenedens sp.]|nr:HDOD domain-containing protein [Candidatus Hydrogenedens sp.]HOL20601.1 HDOD domain-containing protein [Candidatus Hydrogenedens sp.]HPP57656.1 HDOD domain-containing protein [Candidatus Hydrogenedens sp.]
MSEQPYEIITCKCGQRMRVPTSAQGKAFKCVRCGNIVFYGQTPESTSQPGFSVSKSVSTGEFTGNLSQWLISSGIVTPEDMEEALDIQKKQGGYLLKILYQNSKLPEEMLFEILSRTSGVPKIDILRIFIDKEIVDLVPKKLCEDRFVFPVDRLGRNLTLAMACPIDKETIFLVEQLTQLRIKPTLAKVSEIEETIKKYHKENVTNIPLSMPQGSVSGAGIKESKIIKTKPSVTESQPASVLQFPEETADRERKFVEPVLDTLEYLPFPPTAELALSMVLEDSEPNLDDLCSIFLDDPSLATALLRWVNNPVIAEEKKIGNIWTAVALLGPYGVQIMLNHMKEAHQPISEYPVLPISGRSKLCAKLAEELAKSCQKVNPSLAYTTALIHQIGAIVLYIVGQEEYKRLMRDALPEIRIRREMEYFTINHAVASSLLANRWKFPEIIVHALCHYLEPFKAPGKAKDLAHILFVASIAGLHSEESVRDEIIQQALKLREKSIQYLGLDVRAVVKSLG